MAHSDIETFSEIWIALLCAICYRPIIHNVDHDILKEERKKIEINSFIQRIVGSVFLVTLYPVFTYFQVQLRIHGLGTSYITGFTVQRRIHTSCFSVYGMKLLNFSCIFFLHKETHILREPSFYL